MTLDVGPDEVLRHLVLLHVLVGARARGLLALVVAGHVLEGVEDLGARGRRGEISGDVSSEHLQVAEDEGLETRAAEAPVAPHAARIATSAARTYVERFMALASDFSGRRARGTEWINADPCAGSKAREIKSRPSQRQVLVSDEPNRSRAAQRHVVR